MLTPDQIQQLKFSATNGGSPSATTTGLTDNAQYEAWKNGTQQSVVTPQHTAADYESAIAKPFTAPHDPRSYIPALKLGVDAIKDIPHATADAFRGGVHQVEEGAHQIGEGGGPAGGAVAGLEGGLKVGSGVASIVSSPLAEIFKPLGLGIDEIANIVSESPTLQRFANSGAGDITAHVAEDAANAGNIAGTIAGAAGGAEHAPGIVDAAKEAPAKISQLLSSTPEGLPGLMKGISSPGNPIDALRTSIAKSNVDPRLQVSAERGVFTAPDGAPRTAIDHYNDYFDQSKKAVTDVKADPAIGKVGENIGKAYDHVIAQRSAIGRTMDEELSKVAHVPTDITPAFENLETKLKTDAKLAYDPEEGKLRSIGKQNPMTTDDRAMLEQYITDLNGLGTHPTIGDLDAFMKRIPNELDVAKAAKNVTQVTNAERIIKNNLKELRSAFDPEKTGNPALAPYHAARKAYADLSGFLDEGATHLGAKLKTDGEYTRDTSVAKSAAESILGGGKKNWLVKLEGLTGYPALDDAVVAIQAMKDAGDTRGLSLFKALADGGIPTPHGLVSKMVEYASKAGSRLIAGKPEEQTRQFLRYLETLAKKDQPSSPQNASTASGQ